MRFVGYVMGRALSIYFRGYCCWEVDVDFGARLPKKRGSESSTAFTPWHPFASRGTRLRTDLFFGWHVSSRRLQRQRPSCKTEQGLSPGSVAEKNQTL